MSNPTKLEKLHWSRVAAIGCIACALDGEENQTVSIHHTDGRTKPGAHKKVLPLCAGHHQDGTGNDREMIAIHPWKSRFEARYGTQEQLLELTEQLIVLRDGNFGWALAAYVCKHHLFDDVK